MLATCTNRDFCAKIENPTRIYVNSYYFIQTGIRTSLANFQYNPRRQTSFKPQANNMSSNIDNMSSKVDKKIISTLQLLNDNKNKLTLVEILSKCIKRIEGNPLLQDAVNDLKRASDVIKHSNVLTKNHLVNVNPEAKK